MNVLPIVARELRAESRNRHTYHLRTFSAAALLLCAGLLWMTRDIRLGMGGQCFAMMHQVLFWGIWVVVPVMTADCLSREKREGTLGLLFLTPLRASDIVVAKGCAHGLRAATLVLAAAPVLVLPFLVGGIGWAKVLASVCILVSALCAALGAALLASASSRTLTRSIVLAAIWSTAFFVVLGYLYAIGTSVVLSCIVPKSAPFGAMSGQSYGLYTMGLPFEQPIGGFQLLLNFSTAMNNLLLVETTLPGFMRAWLMVMGGVTLCSILSLRPLLTASATKLERHWQQQPRLPLQTETERRLFQPRYGLGLFRRWMHRLLERNPIGWLERRTWQGRVISWTWLAVVISLASAALSNPHDYRHFFDSWQAVLGGLLGLSLALCAAGSFRREREAGVMELLLVAPLRVEQIVAGRLRGLWAQFLPAVLLLIGLWIYLLSVQAVSQHDPKRIADGARHILLFSGVAIVVPVIGLYFSLRCRLLILAVAGTVVAGIVLPTILGELLIGMITKSGGEAPWMDWGLGGLLAAAVLGVGLLRNDYRRLAIAGVAGWILLSLLVWQLLFRASDPNLGVVSRGYVELSWRIAALVAFLQSSVACALGMLLHRSLVRRQFSLPQ